MRWELRRPIRAPDHSVINLVTQWSLAGNKSISLKLCRNVIIRDITIFHGGHFAILATGVDNDDRQSEIGTNRDGVDACKNVRISNYRQLTAGRLVCPKSSFALAMLARLELTIIIVS